MGDRGDWIGVNWEVNGPRGEGGARAVIDKPNGSERIAVESRTCMSDEAITVRKTPQL